MPRIDPHVHCRDGKQNYKETIEHTLKLADQQGVDQIFDMPNTDPPILYRPQVDERLLLVPKGQERRYHLYIGASSDEAQLREAVDCYDDVQPVVGMKLFAGRSVGSLAVVEEDKQRLVFRTLSNAGYTGVLAVHCEKESYLMNELWNPEVPATHCKARPKQAEIESIKDQTKFAKEESFKGTLHILHISCPESIDLVDAARKEMKITCGVTPHHVMWSKDDMGWGYDGLIRKCNPPLRDLSDVEMLRTLLRDGKIDWIETDHAPHQIVEKLFDPWMSGFPSLGLYKDFVTCRLPGLGLSESQIMNMTETNIRKTFGNKVS